MIRSLVKTAALAAVLTSPLWIPTLRAKLRSQSAPTPLFTGLMTPDAQVNLPRNHPLFTYSGPETIGEPDPGPMQGQWMAGE